ncbi:hypothetical protein GJ496_006572 [Pomphorhynchus laevis]|nr:hypothetical protein GJ496_006572 [Pomphorhynchus laevis]
MNLCTQCSYSILEFINNQLLSGNYDSNSQGGDKIYDRDAPQRSSCAVQIVIPIDQMIQTAFLNRKNLLSISKKTMHYDAILDNIEVFIGINYDCESQCNSLSAVYCNEFSLKRKNRIWQSSPYSRAITAKPKWRTLKRKRSYLLDSDVDDEEERYTVNTLLAQNLSLKRRKKYRKKVADDHQSLIDLLYKNNNLSSISHRQK